MSHSTTTKNLLLSAKPIPNLDAELLLAHAIGRSRAFVVAHPEYIPHPWEKYLFHRLVKKRTHGTPLAYLTHQKEFFGLDFFVNHHTLIPRPDTEILVQKTIEEIRQISSLSKNIQKKNESKKQPILIDIGTGTGCIPIAVLKEFQHKNTLVHHTFATDISKKALKIAKKNAKKHRLNITFLHGNLLEPISKTGSIITNHHLPIIITANLPYLTEEQYNVEYSIHSEPKSALVANNHGLALYEELLLQIKKFTVCHLSLVSCFLEINPSQSFLITKIIEKNIPHATISIITDLAGRKRLVRVRINKVCYHESKNYKKS